MWMAKRIFLDVNIRVAGEIVVLEEDERYFDGGRENRAATGSTRVCKCAKYYKQVRAFWGVIAERETINKENVKQSKACVSL